MTSRIVELIPDGAIVEQREDCLGAEVVTRRFLSQASIALLLDGSTPVRGYCGASDALEAAGFWTYEGEVTKDGYAAREYIRIRASA